MCASPALRIDTSIASQSAFFRDSIMNISPHPHGCVLIFMDSPTDCPFESRTDEGFDCLFAFGKK